MTAYTGPARLAISLWQPWASLAADGIKTSETRSWAFPRSLIGQDIDIHATKRPPVVDEMVDIIAATDPGLLGEFSFEALPLGAIVATVRLKDTGKVSQIYGPEAESLSHHGEAFVKPRDGRSAGYWHPLDGLGDYSLGRWVSRFSHVRKWADPQPARGRQGFWNSPTCEMCGRPGDHDNRLVAGICIPSCPT